MISKPMSKRIVLLVILVMLFFLLVLTLYAEEMARIVRVVSVVDGDTLMIEYNGKREPVRLIGIDAPECTMNRKAEADSRQNGESLIETVSRGIDAKGFVENIVRVGDLVALRFDVETRDRDGMLLGYVFLPDGRMLNEEIVRARYARVVTVPPNVKYQERLLQASREARVYRRAPRKPPQPQNSKTAPPQSAENLQEDAIP